MTRLLCVAFVLFGFGSANAQVVKTGEYQSYEISYRDVSGVKVFVQKTMEIWDDCNHYTINGEMLPVDDSRFGGRLHKPYIADFVVVNTLKSCPKLEKPRTLAMSYKNEFYADGDGNVYITILIPKDFEIQVTPF